jgi:hypothetical protein
MILIFFTIIYMKYNTGNLKYSNYIKTLPLVGILISLGGLIYQNNNIEREDNLTISSQYLDHLGNDWFTLESTFLQYYPYSARLYKQMYPELPLSVVSMTSREDEIKRSYVEIHICSIIYQLIENIYIIVTEKRDWNDPRSQEWLTVWKKWFSSPIVRENWKYMKQYYGSDVREIIDANIMAIYGE